MSQISFASRPFVIRAVRALSYLLLFLGFWSVADIVTTTFLLGRNYLFSVVSYFWQQELMMAMIACGMVASYGGIALEIIAAIGMLKSKKWSRPALIVWSLITAAGRAVGSLGTLMITFSSVRSTSQPFQPSPLYYIVYYLSDWVREMILPAVTIWLMMQPEVKDMLAGRGAGGFEVIPMARIASPTDESSSKE